MKRILVALFALLSFGTVISQDHNHSQKDTSETAKLYDTIVLLDSLLFDSYNRCKPEQYEAMLSDDFEFYHDKGGFSSSKKENVEGIIKYICRKVRRELLPGSIEVSVIPGYGAVELGVHRFINLVERSVSAYSKFVIIWQFKENEWKVTRVISLHK